jgi:hypothetical protein
MLGLSFRKFVVNGLSVQASVGKNFSGTLKARRPFFRGRQKCKSRRFNE